MANQIRIGPEQMLQRAHQYRTEDNRIQKFISNMDGLLSQLIVEWEGCTVQSYSARYNELEPYFVKARELINEIASALESEAESYVTEVFLPGPFPGQYFIG